MRRESQKSKIMKYLAEGNSITPLDALEKFGCFRLAAIVHNIKQEREFMENKDLVTTMVTNKFGVKYGSYKLKSKIKQNINSLKDRNQRVLGLIV
tara:strand:+ start:8356 stop:8640 length:285 start_codon:yes stop_codon:yes gene_type:complete